MNRREVLGALGALLLAACDDEGDAEPREAGPMDAEGADADVPDEGAPDAGPLPDTWQATRPTLESLFPDNEALRAIGRAWMQPLDSATISVEIDAVVALIDGDAPATLARLDEAAETEFADLTLAVVAGWHLAPTEARLCGLLERLATG